jgi:hypothetical protein
MTSSAQSCLCDKKKPSIERVRYFSSIVTFLFQNYVRYEAFMATECIAVFSVDQLLEHGISSQCFGDSGLPEKT